MARMSAFISMLYQLVAYIRKLPASTTVSLRIIISVQKIKI